MLQVRTSLFVLGLGLLFCLGCGTDGDNPERVKAGGKGDGGQTVDGENLDLDLHTVEEGATPRVAFVTNGVADFWTIAEAGALKAGEELGIEVEIRMPGEDGLADQQRMVEELLTIDIDGIAISPINPENQLDLLNKTATRTNLITHDSDADQSDRICYIGMSNYEAGRMCGELVKKSIPEGGEVMIFVGRLEQLNARLRRQGLIDELLDRSYDPNRYDEPGSVVKGDKFTILGTRTDQFDVARSKASAEDAISAHPDLVCMVGLFEYNPPAILQALQGAGKLGQIAVVGFDENEETLQAIKDGDCAGTIVQNPYQYGYQSVQLLDALARGDSSLVPDNRYIDIPAREIVDSNVDEFWAELKSLLPDGGE